MGLKYLGLFLLGLAFFIGAYVYSNRFLDWLRFQSLGTRDYIVERLGMMFIEIPPQKILLGLFLMSFGFGTVVFLAFLPHLFPGIPLAILATVVGWKIPKPIVNYMYNRRVTLFVTQMVDALSLMSNGMKSGLSIVQSLGLVTQEMPNPIQQEFNLVLSENRLGVSLEESFGNLAKRIKSEDVEMFVTSINILKETGGNLAETFDTIVLTIRERIRVENKIGALTAQGYYQGVFVMCIPPALALIFSQTDPDFMKPLFTTPLGWGLIFIIFLLELVGFFVIMKIVKIDV
ncbi:MAG: type II secretion system F family protein [Bdellovibrionia bacterium]